MQHESTLRLQLQRLNRIGIALSGEHNLERLLELIVDEARAFTGADGGTLYLVEGPSLQFKIVQNASLKLRMGGASGAPITWPALPLYVDGNPNRNNVSAHVALTGEAVNIPDVYDVAGFNFEGTRRSDERNGYRTRSMLVVPMRDHEEQIIGVLQLLNATDSSGQVVPFAGEYIDLIASLASQAAVAITNARLIQETENLFEALVRVMASAIDERSPATSGHIKRVTDLTVALARAVNESDHPRFAETRFGDDELNELRIAAYLHDVGKVTTPIHIVEKRTKLETLFDRVELIRTRFELIKQTVTCGYLQRRMHLLEQGALPEALTDLELFHQDALRTLDEEQGFIVECNTPVEFMPPERVERVKAIAAKTYLENGCEKPYLTPEEVELLTVQRGNLTWDEIKVIRDHAAVTIRLLEQIPFTRKLRNVPQYAGGHHEKLNGKGYPLGLTAEQLPLQTRMMAIADVYEALTASDRSYKTARSQEDALRILGFMVKDGELDPDLVKVFVESGVYKMYGTSAAELQQKSPA